LRILVVFVVLPLTLAGQLTAPGSNAIRHSAYPSAPGIRDPVFIYCNPSGNLKGALNVISPGGTAPFDFSWFKWSNATKSFSILIKTETGVTNSNSNNLDEGGYRVNISNSGGYSASLTGWIFLDKPYSRALLDNNTCDYVALDGTAAVDTFFYKDPSTGNPVKLPDGVKFLWSSTPASSIPYPDFEIDPRTFSPPVEDVTYMLQVTDSFTCRSESSFFYKSIHTKADFTVDPVKGEAPLEVSFTNKSINGSTYLWEFGDGKDSTSSMETPGPHFYYKPGDYSVKLTSTSEEGCADSLRFDKVAVDKSLLNIPNVFTPDGDGYNDWFIPEKKSMRYMRMEVFSRSGMKVYGFNGEGKNLKDWLGWDGNINNSSIKASPGVYFYLIRAYGWDDVNYDVKKYRGFVYLYR
jgi:gliding motility-associated-like protein